MKKGLFILLAALVMVSVSCSDKEDGKTEEPVDSKLTKLSQSDCKVTGVESRAETSADAQLTMFGEQSIEYVYNGNTLQLTHNNAIYGCDAEDVKVTGKVTGNMIIVTEENLQSQVNCICPIDLTYKVAPLEAGTYTIVINRGTREMVRFSVELKGNVHDRVLIK